MSVIRNALAIEVTFDDDRMWIALADGRVIGVPLVWFPRLLHAAPQQRKQYEISGGGEGLHWIDLDEDISVEHLILGYGDRAFERTPAKV